MPIDIEGDFQPVKHSGGKVTFNFLDDEGERRYQVGFSGASSFLMALFAMYVLRERRVPVGVARLGGIGDPIPPPPVQPSVLVFVASDRDGFFGKLCPRCKRYFRTDAAIEHTWCPYCSTGAPAHNFLSESQLKYIDSYMDAFEKGYETGESITLDLDILVEESGSNTSPPTFAEERQQTNHEPMPLAASTASSPRSHLWLTQLDSYADGQYIRAQIS